MKTLNIAVKLMAIATLSLGVTSGAFANATIANTNANPTTPANNPLFTFSGGVGGTLNTVGSGISVASSGPITSDTGATFSLGTGVTETGAATSLGGGEYLTPFSGGSFEISDGTTDLLSGTFTNTSLINFTSSSGNLGNITLDGVAFDDSSQYVSEFITTHGGSTPVTGDLSLSFSGMTPALSNTGSGGGLAAFSATGFGGTFDATSSVVPESNGSILMLAALAPLALVGMFFRRRRTDSTLV